MQYLLLIYGNESDLGNMSQAELGSMYEEYGKFTGEIIASGHYKGGHELHSVTKATTVRVRDGKPVVTDGPFAETKEQLGGYYLIDAKDLDEATSIAARLPGSKYGSIEVRPIVVREGM